MKTSEPSKKTRGLKKGQTNNPAGRPKGIPNKNTTLMKDAILAAAAAAGADGKGKGGLEGYLTNLALNEKRAFATLLGKVLPMTVVGDPDQPINHQVDVTSKVLKKLTTEQLKELAAENE